MAGRLITRVLCEILDDWRIPDKARLAGGIARTCLDAKISRIRMAAINAVSLRLRLEAAALSLRLYVIR